MRKNWESQPKGWLFFGLFALGLKKNMIFLYGRFEMLKKNVYICRR